MVIHYCLGCKEKRRMTGITLRLFKNGRPALKGFCAKCGTKMSRTLPMFPPLAEGILHDSD